MSQSTTPRRELNSNFTEQTFARSVAAKKRYARRQHTKGFFMNIPHFIKQPLGAAITVVTISMSAVGAYAAINWFSGSVQVSQKSDSILSVDLSSCKGNLPPGVTSADRHNVQFKIVGNPHISTNDLQRSLLEDCEYAAATAFFKTQPSTQSANSVEVATVTDISPTGLTFSYKRGGQTLSRHITTTGLGLFKEGAPATLADFHAGDHILVAYDVPQPWVEDQDPVAIGTMRGVFKTQYDVTQAPMASKNGFYQDNNIAPIN